MAEFNGNDMNTSGMGATVTAVTKKKGRVGLFVGIGVLLVLVACLLVFLFVPVVNNFVKMNVMKPEKYYASVEKEYFKTVAADVSKDYQTVLDTVDNEDGMTSDYAVKLEAGDALKAMFTEAMADSGMNLQLDSAEIAGTASVKDDSFAGNYNLKINDTDIVSMDVLMDMATMEMYAKAPEMFDGWIKGEADNLDYSMYSYDEYDEYDDGEDTELSLADLSDVISAEELEELITRYSEIAIAQLEDVEIEKSEDVEAAGIESKYAVTTTKVLEKDVYSICKDILKEAKGDDTLIDAVVKLGLCTDEEEFVSACDTGIEDLNTEMDSADKSNYIEILTYIDAEGTVRGRELVVYEDKEKMDDFTCRYLVVKDGKEVGIEAELMSDGEGLKLSVNVEEGDKDVYSGNADLTIATTEYDDETWEEVPAEYSISVGIDGFEIVNEDKGLINGTFTLNMNIDDVDLTGTSLKLEADGDKQSVALDVTYNGENYGKITISAEQKNSADDIEMPSESDVVYDMDDEDDVMDFQTNINYETLLQNVGTALGIDQETIDGMIAGYSSGGYGGSGYDDDYYDDHNFNDYYNNDYDGDEDETDVTDSDEVTIDFSKVDISVNGQKTGLPVIIPDISAALAENTTAQIEAGDWDSYQTMDFYVRFDNPLDDTPLTINQCPIERIKVQTENSPIKLALNGVTIGSTTEQVYTAFPEAKDMIDETSSYNYVRIYDEASDWNEIVISISNGKVDSIEIDMMDYNDDAAAAMAKANLIATGSAASVAQ